MRSQVNAIVVIFLAIVMAMGGIADAKSGKGKKATKRGYSPPYSAVVINANNGMILYDDNANAGRYPASLTKMMTLYITFESLKSGKLSMDTELPVSKKAASMPATNLFMEEGDSISVRDAIKALVIRSANDVAVVLAEAQGKTEWNFASMMTAKARQLGMNNTTFKNASGLPDPGQRSTARDMALLGIALKRNFPEYYPYFKTKSFVHMGRTYTTHNRVMLRYDGVDGIKTGYINASGFNLVTSVTKNGVPLVAAVMGGKSGQLRDDQMIALLDKTYTGLAKGTLPKKGTQLAYVRLPGMEAGTEPSKVEFAFNPTPRLKSDSNAVKAQKAELVQVAALTMPAKSVDTVPNTGAWGIQVGAFSKQADAMTAAQKAVGLVAQENSSTPRIQISDTGNAGRGIHRARLTDFTEEEARRACRKLTVNNTSCFVFRAAQES